jgi:type IV secretory pathway VirB2 component (pilin)
LTLPRRDLFNARMAFSLPGAGYPEPDVREMPEAPKDRWGIIGPGLVASGVGLASGEFILWPYISSQVGLVFLWGAVAGLLTQWFLNLEIERYTLATGETALTGFSRLWKHWGLFFALMTYFANAWPGWATSSATMVTFITGGNPRLIAVVMLVAVGAILTLAPVVYTALEKLILVKIVVIGGFFLLALFLAIKADSWAALSTSVTHIARFPSHADLPFAVLVGAIAFAGAGGGQNLCQSNWIRDKGFGMGAHIPRLVSAVTGKEEAAPVARACVFELNDANLSRWKAWWRFCNVEQLVTFVAITAITIVLTSVLAHSTLFGMPGLKNSIDFLRQEGTQLKSGGGAWFGTLFWVIGAYSLFAATVGIIDYTSRLMADVLKWNYFRGSNIRESRLYFGLVWGMVAWGCAVLLLTDKQPLVLLVISSCTSAFMMFIYSILLLVLNRKALPAPLKVRSYRAMAMVWSAAFFGVLSFITFRIEIKKLLG